jgi:hypothetical protein
MAKKWEPAWGTKRGPEVRSENEAWHGMSVARHAERPLSDARRRQYRPSHPGGVGSIAALAVEARAVFSSE